MIAETRMMATDCKAKDYETFTVLEFTDAIGCVVELHLPARMSACAAMIAGAFNAHMLDTGESALTQERMKAMATTASMSEDEARFRGLLDEPVGSMFFRPIDPHAMTAVGERITATQATADRRVPRGPFPTGSGDTKTAEDIAAQITAEGEGHHE